MNDEMHYTCDACGTEDLVISYTHVCPDTVTIRISREDADYFATDRPRLWDEPNVRLKDACRAALREDG